MITDPLQQRINAGDREAFQAVYSEYGRGVFVAAFKELGSEADARKVVKQTFLNLHRELLNSSDDVNLPALIRELAGHEMLLAKIVKQHGSFVEGPPATVASAPADGAVREKSSARSSFEAEPVRAPGADLPPLERAYAYMKADGVLPKEPISDPSGRKRQRPGEKFGRFLLLLMLLILLWAVAGVLMDIRIIPKFDLGYRWFNQTVYPLFSLFL